MKVNSLADIPQRATISKQKVKRGGRTYEYLYAIWKEGGKLKKVYIGKSMDEFKERLETDNIVKSPSNTRGLTRSTKRKIDYIKGYAKYDPFAVRYVERLRNSKCSVAWAERKIREHQARIMREMQDDGHEVNEGDFDLFVSYLNRE